MKTSITHFKDCFHKALKVGDRTLGDFVQTLQVPLSPLLYYINIEV